MTRDLLWATQSACQQLWDWVGEQKNIQYNLSYGLIPRDVKCEAQGKLHAYALVRLYMGKFFSGLIDFKSTGETDGERLPEDV